MWYLIFSCSKHVHFLYFLLLPIWFLLIFLCYQNDLPRRRVITIKGVSRLGNNKETYLTFKWVSRMILGVLKYHRKCNYKHMMPENSWCITLNHVHVNNITEIWKYVNFGSRKLQILSVALSTCKFWRCSYSEMNSKHSQMHVHHFPPRYDSQHKVSCLQMFNAVNPSTPSKRAFTKRSQR